jgi:hypothetical protein
VAEGVEKWINVVAANGVWWGARSTLVAILLHFPELETEVELLGFGRGTDLSDDQADALRQLISVTSDSLASLVSSSLARDSPNDVDW